MAGKKKLQQKKDLRKKEEEAVAETNSSSDEENTSKRRSKKNANKQDVTPDEKKSKRAIKLSSLYDKPKVDPNVKDISSTLATVRYLRQNENALEQLVSSYHLKVRKHAFHTNLICLKYDMLKSPFSSEIVKECRGLILDRNDNYKVVCYPFKKFFNYGEKYNASKDINWKEAKVYEKVDGSLCTLYYYGDQWWISTTGTASGSGYLHKKNKTFDQLFWQLWNKLGYKLPDPNLNKIYMFELFSTEHEIVVKPEKDQIILLGVRDMTTMNEEDPTSHAESMGWELVQTYPFASIGFVLEAAKDLEPSKHEGFVVCDNQFNRIKIKSPRYVALAHLLSKDEDASVTIEDEDNFSPSRKKKMLQIVRNNESSEFLSYYPALEDVHNLVQNEYKKLVELTKYIVKDIKEKYYSKGEEESSNKDAITNFIHRKCQTDYVAELTSIVVDERGTNSDEKERLVAEAKTNKKVAKILKNSLTMAVYQELFGHKSCEEVFRDIEVNALFDLIHFKNYL